MCTLLETWLEKFNKLGRVTVSTFKSTDKDRCVYNVMSRPTNATLLCSNKSLKGRRDSLPLDLDQLRLVLRNIGVKNVRFRVQLVTISPGGQFRKMEGSDFRKKWKGVVESADGVFMDRVRKDGSVIWKDEVSVTLSVSNRSSRRLSFEFQLHPAVLSRNDFTKVDTVGRYALRVLLAVNESDWRRKLAAHDTRADLPSFVSDTFRLCGRRSQTNKRHGEEWSLEQERRKRRRAS